MPSSGKPACQSILHVAINTPVADGFDYLVGDHTNPPLKAGTRLRVPFGRKQTIAILLETRDKTAVAPEKLRHIDAVIDQVPVLSDDLLQLAQWMSRYYQHPLGEVVHTMLPTPLRQGHETRSRQPSVWKAVAGHTATDLARAPKQQLIFNALMHAPNGLNSEYFEQHFDNWRPAIKALQAKGWITRELIEVRQAENRRQLPAPPQLNLHQQQALQQIGDSLGRFQPWLLQGVTGSGKTEVYLRLIEQVLQQNRQTLVLVPEIGLTPQLFERFQSRLAASIEVLHSGISDGQRLQVWLAAQSGNAKVIIGTRSAVFLPLCRPGLIIVDEEHDGSLKQQDGLRYHARDVAVVRAQHWNVPIVLGSATPSLETLNNADNGRYARAELPERAGDSKMPRMALVDARATPKDQALSRPLIEAMQRHLQRGSQVLIFLNRRGFAPMLLCHGCGWTAECSRCDAYMTLHQREKRLRCHHCGHEQPPQPQCPDCGDTLNTMGLGTEQLERFIQQHFPQHSVARIDRDTVRRKGELESRLSDAQSGKSDILIGTQMLAKGHHFPQVTLVGILGIDQGLFSADFRGPEFMAQLVTQVAGRAGRGELDGEVLIETHQPQHPLLRLLIAGQYSRFASAALAERRAAALPPFTRLALIRAEAVSPEQALQFLQQLRERLTSPAAVQLLGPIPAPMERRAGRYRAQLLLQSAQRPALQQVLVALRNIAGSIPERRKVRWSIDIDPLEML